MHIHSYINHKMLSLFYQLLFVCGKTRQWTSGDFNWQELWQVWNSRSRIRSCHRFLAWTYATWPRWSRADSVQKHHAW